MGKINNVTQLRSRTIRRPVKVVAVTGGKGGVGKSAICANVALSLAQLGRRVMLLDGDLGLANAHLMFGMRPRHTLRHVVRGECDLSHAISNGPGGMQLLAGANGFLDMTRLDTREHAGIINCFNEYEHALDVLMIDTAPGISDSVMQFAGAASRAMVVVRDEPASIADAYSIIKLLNTDKGVERFDVVTNMMSGDSGERVFEHLSSTVDRFLPATLQHAGNIPVDEMLARSVRCQRPVVTAFPRSSAARAMNRLAQRIDSMPPPACASGRVEFFVDRLTSSSLPERGQQEAFS